MTEISLRRAGYRQQPDGNWCLDVVFDYGHAFLTVERLVYYPATRKLRSFTKRELNAKNKPSHTVPALSESERVQALIDASCTT